MFYQSLKTAVSTSLGIFLATLILMSCGSNQNQQEVNQLKEETIAVHDEIMPQISVFDQNAIKIDSILVQLDSLKETNTSLDTAQIHTELTELKTKLDQATDQMMQWMMEYETDPEGMTNEEMKAYYEAELEKIKNMKNLFEEVTKESAEKLANF